MSNVQRDTPTPELLAPAGGPEALRAAVNNGADAVYLGVEELNARRGAENFSLDRLSEAVDYAHLRGAGVYLAANVVIKPAEMPAALDMVARAWEAGVDAVIVQDIGLARVLGEALPDVRLHASTQIGAQESETLAELARIGFSRATLAREVSLENVAALVAGSGLDIEVFAHGALCISYSGQCLFSSAVGGRSANRGLCAQPCRLPYDLLDEKGRTLEAPGRYLLSPRDLSTIDLLPRLIDAGVSAIKIEGRMKSPEYVAVVTRIYRAALDRAAADPDAYEVTEAERAALAEVFSRGFTTGHLDGRQGEELMAYSRPNNRGVAVGRVASAQPGSARIDLDRALDAGDVLEFWTRQGRFAAPAADLAVDGRRVNSAPAGARVELGIPKPVSAGDRVFRVVSASLEAAARRTFATPDAGRTVPVDVRVRIKVGEPVTVSLQTGDARGEGVGPVVEKARTKALTAAEVMEHVGRLGGTAFVAADWDVELDPAAGMGFSALHAARRDAVAALEAAMLAPWADRDPGRPSLPVPRSTPSKATPGEMPELVVWTTRLPMARACLEAGAHRVIMPSWSLEEDAEIPEGVSVELPRVVHQHELGDVLALARSGRALVATSLGTVAGSHRAGSEVWAHWGLNAVNPWSVAGIADVGAAGVWLSPEVSGHEVSEISKHGGVPVGIAVLGRQEVMVLEHCVISATARCSHSCAACSRRQQWYALKDRKGYGMPVIVDPVGRTHIFNAVPLDLTRALDEVVEAGVSAVRLDFTVEPHQLAQKMTAQVRATLESVVGGRGSRSEPLYDPATAGHFFRGVK